MRCFARRLVIALSLAALSFGAKVLAKGPLVSTLAEIDIGSGGLAVDGDGNVYAADFGAILGDPSTSGTKVIRVTPDGESSLFADGFEGASGNAFDSAGDLLQANIRGRTISRITPGGEVSTFATEGLQSPVGIVFGADGDLFVANCGNASIQRISADGESSRLVQSSLLACPNGIVLGPDGNLYVSNFYNGGVIKVTLEGEVSELATLPGNNNGHLTVLDGALLVVARAAHQIYRVSLDGEVELWAGSGEKGGDDGDALEASFCFPNDIAVGPDGRTVYVNDVGDHSSDGAKLGPTRIRKITVSP